MEESGGEDREGRDEISLLVEELIQLSVKGSKVVPNSKPTLICTVWTEKLYNPKNFRAQMKSIWKTKKKFEIQRVGQNLFLIVFELEEDLESIIEGRPWLFGKSIILFNMLIQAVERDQLSLNSSSFWIKIDSYLPEFDKKDLIHAIGVMFGLVIRSEINDTCCRLRINLDVQKPLRRESKLVGKESMKFNAMSKNVGVQSSYAGGKVMLTESSKTLDEEKNEIREVQEYMELMGGKEMIQKQKNRYGPVEVEKINSSKAQECKDINHDKKTSWKRIKPMATVLESTAENSTRKRKFPEGDVARSDEGDGTKILKQDDVEGYNRAFSEVMLASYEQTEVQNLLRLAVAKRQSDCTQ
ncbi:hypothetical protein Gogos_019846 [Gossypium gossypioides]|uniref:DUF4283 domain-containing protein n=1 Tax=Gossypium gossypioides TaxID=34282 RepID=A0A7J9CZ88_GOSGO|nr:hypothetical protein [Gossypium gossypioides]